MPQSCTVKLALDALRLAGMIGRMVKTLEWTGTAVRLLDQTQLPTHCVYLEITDERQMHDAIRRLAVRGAPAIGVAAAFGVYLGVARFNADDPVRFSSRLKEVCEYLGTARPTAVNLFWAIDRMKRVAKDVLGENPGASPPCHVVRDVQEALLNEAMRMIDEDVQICRKIGENGLALLDQIRNVKSQISNQQSQIQNPKSKIQNSLTLLTHCNAGALATVGCGTATAPIYVGAERGLKFHVFADETRPLLQGARITAFELRESGIPVTLLCDNMAASVMSQGKVDAVIVGTDRVAANGDVANKIGTHGVAILARHFGIPFFVAAPTSSIDLQTPTGSAIPIEQRNPTEITQGMGRQTAPDGVDVYNPAFDVTPAELVTAIITENGVARPDYRASLRQLCRA